MNPGGGFVYGSSAGAAGADDGVVYTNASAAGVDSATPPQSAAPPGVQHDLSGECERSRQLILEDVGLQDDQRDRRPMTIALIGDAIIQSSAQHFVQIYKYNNKNKQTHRD